MKVLTMKRAAMLCAGLGVVGAVGAFTFSGTSALYSSTADTQTNTITSGTVMLANSPGSIKVDVPALMPGDTYTGQRYALNYTGTGDAFVGVDVTVTSTASQPCATAGAVGATADLTNCTGMGQLPLFDGTASSALDVLMTYPSSNNPGNPPNPDANASVTTSQLQGATTCKVVDGTTLTPARPAGNYVQCTGTVANVLAPFAGAGWLNNDPGTGQYANGGNLIWKGGTTPAGVWISIYGQLDHNASNATQGSTTTVALTGHAVQSANNQSTWGTGGCNADTLLPSYGSYNAGSVKDALPCPVDWS